MTAAWADFYATRIYPAVSTALSWVAAPFGFSLTEIVVVVFIALAIWLIIKAIRRKRPWWRCVLGEMGLILVLVAWFYGAWGLNYFRSNLYERLGSTPMPSGEICGHSCQGPEACSDFAR